jgi:hypothetical protein
MELDFVFIASGYQEKRHDQKGTSYRERVLINWFQMEFQLLFAAEENDE